MHVLAIFLEYMSLWIGNNTVPYRGYVIGLRLSWSMMVKWALHVSNKREFHEYIFQLIWLRRLLLRNWAWINLWLKMALGRVFVDCQVVQIYLLASCAYDTTVMESRIIAQCVVILYEQQYAVPIKARLY